MTEALQRRIEVWTGWAGGPRWLAVVLLAQLAMLPLFVMEPILCVGLVLGVLVVVVVLQRPLLGVGMLIAARLLSTGATVFFRVGSIGIGPYEPALVLCAGALFFFAVFNKVRLWKPFPWRAPFLAYGALVIVSLAWSVDKKDGITSDVLPLIMILANATVILAFVRRWEDFRAMLWFWIGTSVLIGVIAVAIDVLGIDVGGASFQAAEGGGRETGLGQQPNWFAMNLMFIIHTAFGMALVERQRLVRWALVLAGFFVFVMMLKSGSRGGAYATLIGGVLGALAHPLFRRWFGRFAVLTVLVFVVGVAFDFGDSAKALTRIASNVALQGNYRELNWQVCVQMFVDTWGRGIGAGGYTELLPQYNNYVATSLYDYPHGIFWQIVAHFGIPGLLIMGWLVATIWAMVRETARLTRGTDAAVFAWTMPAAMAGYVAWSFLEFTMTEKPFWEFLALYTALYLIARRHAEAGTPVPPWGKSLAGWRSMGRQDEGLKRTHPGAGPGA